MLQAELQRRQDGSTKPACGTEGRGGTYNTGIHVFALFLILGLSTLGTALDVAEFFVYTNLCC